MTDHTTPIKLPPYIYGREAGQNEKVFTLESVEKFRDELLAAATPPQALPNAAPVEPVAKLVEALQFYADGCHQVTLTNIPRKHGFDWDTERQKLNDKGFFMAAENSNGSEHFVEDGTVAAEAIAASAPSRAQAEWISVETRLPDSSRRVLACNPLGYVGAAQYAKGHWNGIGGASGWMELPEPLATPGETK